MDDRMISIGEALSSVFSKIGKENHIEPDQGDYVGEDGYLHCGFCKQRKEFRLPFNGRMVPSMCDCQKAIFAQKQEEQARKEQQKIISDLFSYSIVDEKFYEHTFQNFVPRDQKDAQLLHRLKNYVENFDEMYARNTGLLLYGPPGTGKTFAADCVAHALLKKEVPVLVTSIVRLTSGSVFDDELQNIIRLMRKAKLLVLDDLGAERETSFKMEQLFDLIDSRINNNKPMIITTNITDFKKESDIRYKRVFDRISGCCIPLFVDGESRRLQMMKSKHKDLLSLLDQ